MDRLSELEGLVQTFLEAMNLSLTHTCSEDEDCIRVDLEGPDSYLLLERRASALDALQLILGKVASRRLDLEKRLVVDCEGHRRGYEQRLVETAVRTAEKVRQIGECLELEPMNPYERRLVHIALQKEPGVASESHGDGFLKRILISPA